MAVAVMGEAQKSQIVRLRTAAQGVREHVVDLQQMP
jgi:hypothetical protein